MDRKTIERHVRHFYATVTQPESYRSVFSPDVLWHVPGDNPVAGPYRGEDYFTLMPARMAPLDEWTFELTQVLTNERDRAALAMFHLIGRRRGVSIDTDGAHMLRLDEAGRVIEGWGFTADQATLDRFFSA